MEITNWELTPTDEARLDAVENRARELGIWSVDRRMDLVACHKFVCPLDFEAMLRSDDTLTHDVAGIARHLDRDNLWLTDMFLPRAALPELEVLYVLCAGSGRNSKAVLRHIPVRTSCDAEANSIVKSLSQDACISRACGLFTNLGFGYPSWFAIPGDPGYIKPYDLLRCLQENKN